MVPSWSSTTRTEFWISGAVSPSASGYTGINPPGNDSSRSSNPSVPPTRSSVATCGELNCGLPRNSLTLPENRASIPGRSFSFIHGWLKNVQLILRLLSLTVTVVMLRGRPRRTPGLGGNERTSTAVIRTQTVAASPMRSLARSVSCPRWLYRRG